MKITREDDDGGALLNYAVRYALGRYSYAPGQVMDAIRPMLPDCNGKTLWCFEKDITSFLEDRERKRDSHIFKTDPYTIEWARFREDVVKEIERRKTEE